MLTATADRAGAHSCRRWIPLSQLDTPVTSKFIAAVTITVNLLLEAGSFFYVGTTEHGQPTIALFVGWHRFRLTMA